jgi:hypothetical protein
VPAAANLRRAIRRPPAQVLETAEDRVCCALCGMRHPPWCVVGVGDVVIIRNIPASNDRGLTPSLDRSSCR